MSSREGVVTPCHLMRPGSRGHSSANPGEVVLSQASPPPSLELSGWSLQPKITKASLGTSLETNLLASSWATRRDCPLEDVGNLRLQVHRGEGMFVVRSILLSDEVPCWAPHGPTLGSYLCLMNPLPHEQPA